MYLFLPHTNKFYGEIPPNPDLASVGLPRNRRPDSPDRTLSGPGSLPRPRKQPEPLSNNQREAPSRKPHSQEIFSRSLYNTPKARIHFVKEVFPVRTGTTPSRIRKLPPVTRGANALGSWLDGHRRPPSGKAPDLHKIESKHIPSHRKSAPLGFPIPISGRVRSFCKDHYIQFCRQDKIQFMDTVPAQSTHN